MVIGIKPVIRTLKKQCVHRQRVTSIQRAIRAIGEWIHPDNHQRPHKALDRKAPAEAPSTGVDAQL